MKRSSGILLPIFSLPSRYGIGNLGREAYKFIDFLKRAGQGYWQILPIGPTGFGDSPYQSFSSFAGNPYFIDPDGLIEDGLLQPEEAETVNWGNEADRIDYNAIYTSRESILKKASDRFYEGTGKKDISEEFLEFCEENRGWLEDYALFMAIKKHFDMKPWKEWQDEEIRKRKPSAIKSYKQLLSDEIRYHRFVQFVFFSQWEKLRNYAHISGIKIIGDLPIYISMDSADAWVSARLLKFNNELQPVWVAGVPPDYFSEKGQLWGNPIYDWPGMKRENYGWWIKRLKAASDMFDALRLDHFRGFDSYWQVHYGREDATEGEWVRGPGWSFLKRVKRKLPDLEIIAEDLGDLNENVHKLVQKSGFPGMKVLQFAFGAGSSCEHLPHLYTKRSVVYTGTHDNNTVKGWLDEDASDEEKAYLTKYLGLGALTKGEKWSRRIIRAAMSSVADLCIIPVQDYLDLPGNCRINTPSTLGGNWQWRLKENQLTNLLADEIKDIAMTYGRMNGAT